MMRKLTEKEQKEFDALHPLEQEFYEPPTLFGLEAWLPTADSSLFFGVDRNLKPELV